MQDLENSLLSMGLSPADAKKFTADFKTGLEELGLSDNEVPQAVEIVHKNNNLETALLKVGVKPIQIQKYSKFLDQTMIEFNIESKNQIAMFLAQILHESGMLTNVIENLNYSELGLVKTFKKHFDRNSAKIYARNPEKIANRVYANSIGNGPESSGDGWKYRGRGLIQLTGKENYINCGEDLGIDLIKNPDYLITPEGASRSAGWFWQTRKLNVSANKNDIITNTRIINGGSNGLEHRIELYRRLLPNI